MADTPVVVQKAYEFNLWMIQKVGSFPKSYRFSVGERLINGVLDILMRLVDTAYARDKEKPLTGVGFGGVLSGYSRVLLGFGRVLLGFCFFDLALFSISCWVRLAKIIFLRQPVFGMALWRLRRLWQDCRKNCRKRGMFCSVFIMRIHQGMFVPRGLALLTLAGMDADSRG